MSKQVMCQTTDVENGEDERLVRDVWPEGWAT
jgi:hypothetical protein